MRLHHTYLLLPLSLLLISGMLRAQDSGHEYWLVFQKNFRDVVVDDRSQKTKPADELTLGLVITGDRDARGVVQIPGRGMEMPFSIRAGAAVRVLLDTALQMRSSERVERLAVVVRSDVPVSVVGINRRFQTADTYLAYAAENVGTSYRAACYAWLQSDLLAQMAVVATEDNTHVTITPSSMTQAGRPAGVPFDVVLNRGEAYQVLPKYLPITKCDLTGTLVTADRPVAVFSGHNCAYVPDARCKACNHLVEQMPPVTAWGRTFAVGNLDPRSWSVMRVVAATEGTHVTIDNGPAVTLAAGGFHDTRISKPVSVTADAPVMVVQYSPGFDNGDDVGDPMMIVVPPVERWVNSITFSTPFTDVPAINGVQQMRFSGAEHVAEFSEAPGVEGTERFVASFANRIVVTTTAGTAGALMLDGKPVNESTFRTVQVAGNEYAVATIEIAPGVHTLVSSTPFGAYLYGFGRDKDVYDAYGHGLVP